MPKQTATAKRSKFPAEVSITELSILFDVSERNLYRHAARGVLVRAATPGRFELLPSIRGYLDHLREQVAQRGESPEKSLATARRDLTEVQKHRAELQLQRELSKLITNDEAITAWAEIKLSFRSGIERLNGRIAGALPRLSTIDRRSIADLCHEVLTELVAEFEMEKIPGVPLGEPVVDASPIR